MGHSVDFFDGHKTVAAPKGLAEDPRLPEKPTPKSNADFRKVSVDSRDSSQFPATA